MKKSKVKKVVNGNSLVDNKKELVRALLACTIFAVIFLGVLTIR